MKDFIIRTILTCVLFIIPLIPLFIIEPTHKGTDLNVYSFISETYIKIVLSLFGGAWYYTASKIVDYFLDDVHYE